jgi:hypothetical protein
METIVLRRCAGFNGFRISQQSIPCQPAPEAAAYRSFESVISKAEIDIALVSVKISSLRLR